jgi:hypothetical protein
MVGMFSVVLALGMAVIGCDDDNDTIAERWSKYVDPESTATLDYSVDDDGVNTIIVGGTAEAISWNAWRVNSSYEYTAQENKNYTYTFEAWTASGERTLNIQYYYEEGGADLNLSQEITDARTTYTLTSETVIPKSRNCYLSFHCADKIGTFYIKIISIVPVES